MSETEPVLCDLTEDHEQYAGKIMPDPWEDPSQTDWPMNPESKEVPDGGVGTD